MSKIDFKINKKNLIPNIKDYIKILISSFITVYIFKGFLIYIFPALDNLAEPWDLIFWVILIVYFKNLIDVKFGGRDYF